MFGNQDPNRVDDGVTIGGAAGGVLLISKK